MMRLKAQGTLYALVAVFVMILAYSQLYEHISPFITSAIDVTDPATGALISLLPLALAIVIVLSLIYGVAPGGVRRR